MKVDAWCQEHGITKANYYYRLRRVREACLELCDQAPSFVELTTPPESVFCQVLFPEKSVRIPCFRQGIFPAFGGAQLRIPAHEGMLHPVAFSLKDQ